MTKPVAYFLDKLRVHLLARGPDERAKLLALYHKRLAKKLKPQQLSKWLNLRECPSFDVGLVLLTFAFSRGVIGPGEKSIGLFVYLDPEPVTPAPQLPPHRKLAASELRKSIKFGRVKA